MTALLNDITTEVATEYLCDFRIRFARTDVFETPLGLRITYVVEEGRAEGPRLSGTFLAGGGDWVVVGADRVARLDVRATLRTDDGADVFVTNTGRARLGDDASARLFAGELVRADEMYARSSPLFETGDERYGWLNSLHTIAVNQLSMSEVQYRVHGVV
ncbi:MAG TPA: DUF3237 domain-containing protein [Aquihabitans sp.]|jgi:hypothetical protein|nr:DUF3237 domain-containing protein [Aquihabitans sp.]